MAAELLDDQGIGQDVRPPVAEAPPRPGHVRRVLPVLRPAARRGAAGGRRAEVRTARGAGPPPVARRRQARRRRQRACRCRSRRRTSRNGCIAHRRRLLPPVPALPALEPGAGEGVARAAARLRRLRALEVPLRPARPRHVPAGQRPGLRRRRADRGEPDAGRGVRQHARSSSRPSPRSTATPTSRPSTGRAHPVGEVPRGARASTPRTSSAPTTSPATWRTTRTCRSRRSWASARYAMLAECAATQAEADRVRARSPRSSPRMGEGWPTTATTTA